jgi:hypothetical protein
LPATHAIPSKSSANQVDDRSFYSDDHPDGQGCGATSQQPETGRLRAKGRELQASEPTAPSTPSDFLFLDSVLAARENFLLFAVSSSLGDA